MKRTFLIALTVVLMLTLLIPLGYCLESRWGGVDTIRQLRKVIPGYLQSAGTAFGGSASMTSSETAVPLSYSVVFKHISATTSAGATLALGTLPNGTKGQLLKIYITDVGVDGDRTGSWVLTPTTKTGYASLTFNAAGDEAVLLYIDSTTGWILLSSISVTVASPY